MPFPITAKISNEVCLEVEKLAKSILKSWEKSPVADTAKEEKLIDKFIYSLYDLTSGEINIIERLIV